MSKFTLGPWKYRKNSFNCQGTRWQSGSIIGNGMYIAAIEGDMLESNANANLIAAAPELYEELKEIVVEADTPVFDDERLDYVEAQLSKRTLKQARAVLFKVDGGVDEGKCNDD